MRIKIWNFFTKNIVWKLLSLFLAILIWFIVVNYTNPLTTKRFRVPLTILNEQILEGNDFLISNKSELDNTFIELYIRAPKAKIDALTVSDLLAYIDLEPIDFSYSALLGEPLPITVRYTLPVATGEVISYSPDKVNIVFDKYMTKTFPITIDTSGELPEGYLSPGVEEIEPKSVMISGSRSTVNAITSVRVHLDIADATSTINETLNIVVYDDLNKDITDKVDLSAKTAEITFPVSKSGRVYINQPNITGTPGEGFAIISVDYYPKYIEVVGDEEALNSLTGMSLDTISITGISETTEFVIDTRSKLIANNLNVKNFSPHLVTVTVTVEEIVSKEFEVPINNVIVMGASLSYSVEEEYVLVTLKAPAGVIDRLSATDIALYVDMADDEAGIYVKPVNISFPENLEIQGSPPTVTVVLGEG